MLYESQLENYDYITSLLTLIQYYTEIYNNDHKICLKPMFKFNSEERYIKYLEYRHMHFYKKFETNFKYLGT